MYLVDTEIKNELCIVQYVISCHTVLAVLTSLVNIVGNQQIMGAILAGLLK